MHTRHLFTGLLIVSIPLACSAGGGAGKAFPSIGNGTGGSAAGSTGTGSTVGAGSTVGTGGFIAGTGGAGAGTGGADASACPSEVKQPEQIITYKDATVTDTIYSYSPIAIYVMQDRSGSMLFNGGWTSSVDAITQFVDDPSSAGLYIGMGAFPPASNTLSVGNCVTECATPIVPIDVLPQNAQSMKTGYSNYPASLLLNTPTECGLNGMVTACTGFKSSSGIECVGLLITDGTPTACNTSDTVLAGILSTAYSTSGMKTFVLGLPGADITRLNTLAAAGQTGTAIDLTAGVSAQKMVDAFNAVRQMVATQVSSQVVTQQTTISTQLPCEWGVPAGITPNLTNLEFTADSGVPSPVVEQLGYAKGGAANCANVAGDAWYYDNDITPTKIYVCPTMCDKIKAAVKPRVDIIYGCTTVEAPPR